MTPPTLLSLPSVARSNRVNGANEAGVDEALAPLFSTRQYRTLKVAVGILSSWQRLLWK